MTVVTVKVEGMMCGMCESHINQAIRNAFPVKKVTSSHIKGITTIITENDIPEEKIKQEIDKTGYRALKITKAPYEKKGLFGRKA